MPDLKPFKFVVMPVLLQTDDGEITGEVQLDAVPLYGVDELRRFCDKFDEELARLNATTNGGPPDG